ncbi:hypothetical protein FJT64_002349 [Amphibalanus amphitrite]|uniref:Uncharacterized protein n=1 Tax=Amphibalanus amphitrite TaxID=1232801 RepID=A0A6A4WTB9_AMPAM|nr:hypothetical protein FJT64_002349 [Amphibalanus amphitrite]
MEGIAVSPVSDDGRVYVDIDIDGCPMQLLADSGATVSCLPTSFRPNSMAKDDYVIAANGSRMPVYGLLNCSVSLSGATLMHGFIITDVQRGVVGADLLQKFGASIDFDRGAVLVGVNRHPAGAADSVTSPGSGGACVGGTVVAPVAPSLGYVETAQIGAPPATPSAPVAPSATPSAPVAPSARHSVKEDTAAGEAPLLDWEEGCFHEVGMLATGEDLLSECDFDDSSDASSAAMVPPSRLSQLFVRPDDAEPMEFHLLAGLPRPERCRLQALVEDHGGALVANPARCPHAVTLGAGAPGSQPRPAVSDRPDTFSTQFLDECVRRGRVVPGRVCAPRPGGEPVPVPCVLSLSVCPGRFLDECVRRGRVVPGRVCAPRPGGSWTSVCAAAGWFLDECVRRGRVVSLCPFRLQPTSLYSRPGRVNAVLLGRCARSDLAVVTALPDSDSDDELRLLAAAGEPGRGAAPYRGRLRFSREKDEALVRFVAEHGCQRYAPPTAPKFWHLKAFLLPALLADHPPLSLHTHFIKQVRPRLADFKSTVPVHLVARAAEATATRLALTEDERRAVEQRERDDSRQRRRRLRQRPSSAGDSDTSADDLLCVTDSESEAGRAAAARPVAFADTRAGAEATSAAETAALSPELAPEPEPDPEPEPARGDSRRSLSPAFQSALSDSDAAGPSHAADAQRTDTTRRLRSFRMRRRVAESGSPRAARRPESGGEPTAGSPSRRARGAGRRGRRLYSQPPLPEEYPERAAAGRRLRAASDSPSSASSSDDFHPPPRKASRLDGERPAQPGPSGLRPARRSRRLSSSDSAASPDPSRPARRSRRLSSSDSAASPDPSRPARRSRRLSSSDYGGDADSSARSRRERQAYSRAEEDVLLRRVLAEHAAGGLLGGRRVWERLQDSGVLPGRSWQSLKEHWRRMAPRLRNSARLTESQRRQLCRALRRPAGPGRRGAPARPYARAEDLAMLRYLQEEPRRALGVSGRALWQEMAAALARPGRPTRSWQSLKERFHKRIAPALREYREVDSAFRRSLADRLCL